MPTETHTAHSQAASQGSQARHRRTNDVVTTKRDKTKTPRHQDTTKTDRPVKEYTRKRKHDKTHEERMNELNYTSF